MTNSWGIAAHFEKNHYDVLRDIDRLLTGLEETGSADLRSLMFQEVSAFDPSANRELRSFDMNRDGFTLLAMGYTGTKALRFKLALRSAMGSHAPLNGDHEYSD